MITSKKVVKDCPETQTRKFFPKNTLPAGLRYHDGNLIHICQQKSRSMIKFSRKKKTYYTTLFEQGLGIAVYSAYKLTSADLQFQPRQRPTWQENEGILKNTKDRRRGKGFSNSRSMYQDWVSISLLPARG